jgi:hypothetical protein
VIEFDDDKFKHLRNLGLLESRIRQNSNSNVEIENITKKVNGCETYIPNIVGVYNINIKPKSYINLQKYINRNLIMVILYNNDTDIGKLQLVVNTNKECSNNKCGNYGYFYNVNKKMSIFKIFPLYNNSDKIINVNIFSIKKPFWYI